MTQARKELAQFRMDWHIKDINNTPMCEALALAADYYAVKYGTDPTRAWIHSSQLSESLAAVALEMGITIIEIGIPYNINHIMLSCGD